jgi:hypothetical protein
MDSCLLSSAKLARLFIPDKVFSGYSNTYQRSLEPILKDEYRNVDRLTSLTWKKDLPGANTLAYFAVVSVMKLKTF